jgi:hypothetical protein
MISGTGRSGAEIGRPTTVSASADSPIVVPVALPDERPETKPPCRLQISSRLFRVELHDREKKQKKTMPKP